MYLGMIGEPGSTKSLGEVELRNEKHGWELTNIHPDRRLSLGQQRETRTDEGASQSDRTVTTIIVPQRSIVASIASTIKCTHNLTYFCRFHTNLRSLSLSFSLPYWFLLRIARFVSLASSESSFRNVHWCSKPSRLGRGRTLQLTFTSRLRWAPLSFFVVGLAYFWIDQVFCFLFFVF
jgi:hypothetical protein